jgi:hypothetical protein
MTEGGPKVPPLHVIYITGAGRSGTTILDRVIGSSFGAWSGGEIERLFENLHDPARRCGCGSLASACEFWRAVLEDAFGGFERAPAARFEALRHAVFRDRMLWRIWLPYKPESLRSDLREYRSILGSLYGAIAHIAGTKTIVDSSKNAALAWVLASTAGIRLSTIHVVRDSRAVAFSWTRTEASASPVPFREQRSALTASWKWTSENMFAETLRLCGADYVRVRYEDVVRDPRAGIGELCQRLSLEAPAISTQNTTTLRDVHMIAGNPVRFLSGEVTIREDDEWKRSLSRHDSAFVTLITAPLLLRHGYSLSYR